MYTKCRTATAHGQNILHGDTLCNIKREKYKTVCAEFVFFGMQLDCCNIQGVQRLYVSSFDVTKSVSIIILQVSTFNNLVTTYLHLFQRTYEVAVSW
jgi:hypothetical protein